ncbi:hypothetical protein NHX12_020608 [Muraenolepis orangiensis]|uniref:Phosphorylated adapter RNA export protein n=1 Tax=Muraenolepis orangiensis TaxID=630683 RepID=A0A9Q0EXF0_9TELE|nr:hypothetical protein NHX12_020608 [Muraenolepis orangiensis]
MEAMHGDLEDGELSESDMTSSVDPTPPAYRPAPQPAPSGYRNSTRAADSSDSGGDSEEDDEAAAALWRRKRQKVSTLLPPPPAAPQRLLLQSAGSEVPAAERKVNNIWGSVVQEQSQDQVMAGLGVFGMEADFDMGSRAVETYNYVLARKMMDKERREEEEKESRGRRDQETSLLDSQLEDYMRNRGSRDRSDPKRKRSAKERLGPRAELAVGRYPLTEEDPEERVVEELAHRLQEPKLELLQRAVRVLGRGQAIDLLERTEEAEREGGVTTLDGSRRRTPGGVFLHLMKSCPGVSKAQLRQVFAEEDQEHRRNKKDSQKRRRHLVAKKMKQALNTLHLQKGDQGSQETLASHHTLSSLGKGPMEEEADEEDEEEEEQVEVAVGIEDTPVVYNSVDLEVF